jgi:hypothetical protein
MQRSAYMIFLSFFGFVVLVAVALGTVGEF